jgi:hypothetical protein
MSTVQDSTLEIKPASGELEGRLEQTGHAGHRT